MLFSCNAKKEKKLDGDTNKDAVTTSDYQAPQDSVNADIADSETQNTDASDLNNADANDASATDTKEPVMIEEEDGSLSEVPEEELNKAEKKSESDKMHVKKFYVIAGSFQNIRNASDLRNHLKSINYPAMVLYPYRGYNRVAVNSFTKRADADKYIASIRKKNLSYKKENLEYWLLWR